MHEPKLSPFQTWAVVLVATTTMAVSYVDRQAFAVLAPTITKDLAISEVAFGWLGSAFSLAYLVGAPLAGWLVDRAGARRGLVTAVLLWSLVAGLHAVVPSLAALFVLRLLLGATEAPSFPGAAQAVSRVLPPERASQGFGLLFTGSSIGAAISGALAPALAGWFGWRVALLLTAVAGLAWIPLWLAATSGAAAPLLDARPAASAPRPPLGALLRDRDVLRSVALVLAAAPLNGLVLQYGAKILVSMHGLTQADVGRFLWLPPLALDAGAILFGFLFARTGRGMAPPRLLVAIALACAAAIAGLGFTSGPGACTAAMCAAIFGGGALYTLTTADLLRRLPPTVTATAGGILAASQSLVTIVAFPLFGAVVASTGTYHFVALGLAAWVVAGALVWMGVPARAR